MGIVAIHTIHLSLKHRVMLREAKLGMLFLVAFEARLGILTRVMDEDVLAAACLDVFASSSVARFTATYAMMVRVLFKEPRVNAAGKLSGNLCMAIFTFLITDEMGPFDLRRDHHRARHHRAR